MSDHSVPALSDLTLREAEAIEEVCTRFENAWKGWREGPPRVEGFLREMAGPAGAVLLAELVRLEIDYRLLHGQVPNAAEYRQRFPDRPWLDRVLQTIGGTLGGDAGERSECSVTLADAPIRECTETDAGVDGFGVPGYEILGELGRGGMGVVYKARQAVLNRTVALKMILAGGHADRGDLARFKAEAEAVARLQHPGIVQIHEVGEHHGLPYFSLEFCCGGSLHHKLGGTPLQALEAASIVEKLARAMHAAHGKGVIHRDLKPANVLLAEDGEPKITDFGLARKLDQAGQTQTGAVIGTASYMAPEQAQGRGKELGPACDVYALGAILYECLTGRPPFRAATVMDTLMQVVAQEPVPPRQLNPRVPLDLETVCLKCLRKEPARRYDAALSLAEDLARFRRREPISARPVGRIERAARWCRRNPALAGSLAAAVLILILGAAISTTLAIRATRYAQRAEDERRKAEGLAGAEETARKDAEEERDRAEGLVYAGQLELAQAAWRENNLAEAWGHLESTRWDYRSWEYDYLHALFTRNQHTLSGHAGPVHGVCIRPDGTRIVSGGGSTNEPGEVKVWDAQSGREVLHLKGHTRPVLSVSISPDGKRIVSGSEDQTLRVWDARSGRELLTIEGPRGPVRSVSFSPDGQRILSGGHENPNDFPVPGEVKLWDARTGREVLHLRGHEHPVSSVGIDPDGNRAVSADDDGTVKVWDARTGREILAFKAHDGPVSSVSFSPDGQRILSGGQGNPPAFNDFRVSGEVKVWDAQTGREVLALKSSDCSITGVSFSPDGRRIVGANGDGALQVWDAHSGREVLTLKGHRGSATSARFGPDGKCIVSAGHDGAVKVWDARGGQEILTLRGQPLPVVSVGVSPDGKRVASGSGRGKFVEFEVLGLGPGNIKVWDAHSGRELLTLEGHAGSVDSVSFSPDGKRILSGSGSLQDLGLSGEIKVWDAESGREVLTLKGHEAHVHSASFSPDGKRIVSGGHDGAVKVWDAGSGREVLTLKGHTDRVLGVGFSPDGKRIVSASEDRTLKLWDARGGREPLTLEGHAGGVLAVSFSPDGKRVVSGGRTFWKAGPGEIKVWDAESGRELLTLKEGAGPVTGVCFSADGKRIVCASSGMLKVRDARSGQELLTLKEHTSPVTGACFSADGKRLVSAGLDAVKVWDARSDQETLTLNGHTGRVTCANASPDGKRIVSGSRVNPGFLPEEGELKLWDARSGQEILTFRGETGPLVEVGFSPDGESVVGKDQSGKTLAWNAGTGQPLPSPPGATSGGTRVANLPDGRVLRGQGSQILLIDPKHQSRAEDLARRKLTRWTRFDPEWHRGELLDAQQSGDAHSASFHLGRLLREYPYDAGLHLQRAQALAQQGKANEAATEVMHALFLHPRVR